MENRNWDTNFVTSAWFIVAAVHSIYDFKMKKSFLNFIFRFLQEKWETHCRHIQCDSWVECDSWINWQMQNMKPFIGWRIRLHRHLFLLRRKTIILWNGIPKTREAVNFFLRTFIIFRRIHLQTDWSRYRLFPTSSTNSRRCKLHSNCHLEWIRRVKCSLRVRRKCQEVCVFFYWFIEFVYHLIAFGQSNSSILTF